MSCGPLMIVSANSQSQPSLINNKWSPAVKGGGQEGEGRPTSSRPQDQGQASTSTSREVVFSLRRSDSNRRRECLSLDQQQTAAAADRRRCCCSMDEE